MAYNQATGQWEMEDDSVSNRVTGLISADSPYMKQARTQGMQTANKRGLLNSSIGTEAGASAAYKAAVPIASQEASQIGQRNLQGMGIASTERIAGLNVAAHDREKSTAAATAMENIYSEAFRTIGSQNELPSATRDKYLQHIARIRDSNMSLVEQLYGIDLDWASPTLSGT